MQVTSTSSTAPKRTRAKAKDDGAASASKPRSRKKSVGTGSPAVVDMPESVVLVPASENAHDSIATAAYFLAAKRNFAPGHELDDWLEAERLVRMHAA